MVSTLLDMGLARVARRRGLVASLNLEMSDAEAAAIAIRLARFIGRRISVRADLADATDIAGTGTGIARYVRRVFRESAPGQSRPSGPNAEELAAMRGGGSAWLSSSPVSVAAPAPAAPPQAPTHAPGPAPAFEPGAGEVRSSLLGGL